jgi:sensor c-di-GMP phosphodiesterase-like protein
MLDAFRSRIPELFAASILLTALFVASSASWLLPVWEAKTALRYAAVDAVALVEDVLDEIVEDVRAVSELTTEACTSGVRQRLEATREASPYIKHTGMIDSFGLIRCSDSASLDERRLFQPSSRFLLGDEQVRIAATTLLGQEYVAVLADAQYGRNAFAMVPIGLLNRPFGTAVLDASADVAVVFPNAGIAAHPKEEGLHVHTLSAHYGFEIHAASSNQAVQRAFLDNLPWFLTGGVLAGGLLAYLTYRSIRVRNSMAGRIQQALDRNEILVHYQPFIRLSDHRCIGVEALMRWNHSERGMIPPDAFIPIAETTGLIVPLTRRLMEIVAEELGDLLGSHPDFHVAINLAAVHLETDDVIGDIERIFGARGIPLRQIAFEATERQAINETDFSLEQVKKLQSLGSSVLIDDFGTGHSGLSYLQKLPVNGIKIDRLFTQTVGTDVVTRPVLDIIIDLGKRLDLTVVAEGIETAEQADYLRRRGVDYAQGFYWSRPLPVGVLQEYLASEDQRLAEMKLGSAIPTGARQRYQEEHCRSIIDGLIATSETGQGALEIFFESLPVAVVLAEPDGRVVFGNSAVERVLGHPVIHSPNISAYGEWKAFCANGEPLPVEDYPLAKVLKARCIQRCDFLYGRDRENAVPVRSHGFPLLDPLGDLFGAVVFGYRVEFEKVE